MKNMDKQLFAAFILLGVSPFCSAKLDCETIAGTAAGEANYLYESAKVKTDSRLHFYSAPAAYDLAIGGVIDRFHKIIVGLFLYRDEVAGH